MIKKDYFHFLQKGTKAEKEELFKATLAVSWGRTGAQESGVSSLEKVDTNWGKTSNCFANNTCVILHN